MEERGSGIVTTLKLVHGVRPVEVLVKTQLDGTSVLTRWLEITNAGERDAAVSEISVMSGAWAPRRAGATTCGPTAPVAARIHGGPPLGL